MKLTGGNVDLIFSDCLFRDDEIVDGKPVVEPVKGEGITITSGFHPERLEAHRNDISELIDQLPEEFKEGMSFLNMCNDKDGRQWTGFHRVMEQLVMLAMATEKLSLCAPREMWPVLPGGMPYYKVESA
jgi:hypothetical protein